MRSLEDVKNTEIDTQEVAWGKRLGFRITQLYAIGVDRKLTPWEQDFISDMKGQMERNRLPTLSLKQRQFILKIYQTYLEKGYVKMPEGAI